MRAYVGVDWSATKAVCATALDSGAVKGIRGCDRSILSVQELLRRVRERHPEAEKVHVMIEAGAPGWVRLLDAAGAVVHVADAKQAKRFGESLCSSGAKDDRRDAKTLVHMLRSPAHCPPAWRAKTSVEPLERLSVLHEQVSKDIVRHQQRLRCVLREHMPEVDAAITNLRTGWARRFLRRIPTPWHAEGVSSSELNALCYRLRKPRRDAVKAAVAESRAPWLNESLASIEAMRVNQHLDALDMLLEQLASINEAIDEETAKLPARPILESVDGIGLQQCATLLQFAFASELLHRDHAAVQLGACPVFRGSGERKNGTPKGSARMRRAAHHRGRRSMYLLGRLASQHHAWAAAMYADGRARGQSAATAYRRIARSFLRILTAMVRDGVPYDESRYVTALQARGVPWAMNLSP